MRTLFHSNRIGYGIIAWLAVTGFLAGCTSTEEPSYQASAKMEGESPDKYEERVLLERLQYVTSEHDRIFEENGVGSEELSRSHANVARAKKALDDYYKTRGTPQRIVQQTTPQPQQQTKPTERIVENSQRVAKTLTAKSMRQESSRQNNIKNIESLITSEQRLMSASTERLSLVEKQIEFQHAEEAYRQQAANADMQASVGLNDNYVKQVAELTSEYEKLVKKIKIHQEKLLALSEMLRNEKSRHLE